MMLLELGTVSKEFPSLSDKVDLKEEKNFLLMEIFVSTSINLLSL